MEMITLALNLIAFCVIAYFAFWGIVLILAFLSKFFIK